MDDALFKCRHSAAHVMAQAICEQFPGTKLTIGPPTEEGFYYDVEAPERLTEAHFPALEKRMRDIIAENHPFVRKEVSREEAKQFFAARGDGYKLELIDAIPSGEPITFYQDGSFVDLCRGPHVERTGDIKAVKLLSVAGAYWRGDEKNAMLQRVYGTAFQSEEALQVFLKQREEAERRDHRKLGKELDLFSIHHDTVGGGLVHWHPKGAALKRLVEEMWVRDHLQAGYQLVTTPHIVSEKIYKISGHLENYADFMYSPMDIDGRPFRAKPMNCPGHMMIYNTRRHSYREMPVRLAELGTCYRYEKAGVLHGLLRVRGLTIDDAHIFCRPDQVEAEVVGVLGLVRTFMARFGFSDLSVFLATRPEKAIGSPEQWEKAVASLGVAAARAGFAYEIDEGGGAFYGPKIDVKVRDAIGRLWQCSTVQFDFNQPDRFDLVYVDDQGKLVRPYVVHRAIMGSEERFLGILIEHYGGAFPSWLAPVQLVLITVNDEVLAFAQQAMEALKRGGVRVELDQRNEKLGAKIRDAQLQKVPYMAVIGRREAEAGTLALRHRTEGDKGAVTSEAFIELMRQERPE